MRRLVLNLLRGGIAVLVLVALVLSLVRLALAQPAIVTPWAERVVTAVMGERAAFDGVSGRLRGLSPELNLAHLRVGADERELHLESLQLRLDTLASLWRFEPVLTEVRASGARLRVTRHGDGSVRVQGRQDNLFAKMPFPERLVLSDFAIDWRDGGTAREPLRLRSVVLQARAAGGGARIRGRARIGGDGGALRVRADLEQLPRAEAAFNARIHLGLQDVDARALSERGSRVLAESGRPIGGHLNGAVWLRWQSDALKSVTAAGRWDEPVLGSVPLPGRVDGRVAWRSEGSRWRIGVSDDGADTRLALARDGAANGWRLGVRALPVGAWKAWLSSRDWLPERIAGALARAQPAGRVERLVAGWRGPDWRVAGRVLNTSLAAGDSLPGVSDINAEWQADPAGGTLSLGVDSGTLRWPGVLRQPMDRLSADGVINWRRQARDRIAMRLAEFTASSRLVAGTASGRLRLGPDNNPQLQGTVGIDRGDGAELLRRLTPEAQAAGSVDALAETLERASVTGARLTIDGPLSQLPFKGPRGDMRLRLGFREARLDYAPDWPMLKAAAGELRLSREGLGVHLQRGSFAGVPLRSGKARIPDFESPELLVSGQAETRFKAWRALIDETPLTVPAPLARWQFEGEPGLRLELAFPMDGSGLKAMTGRLELNGATAMEPRTGYRLESIEGSVAFDREGLRWQGVSARLRGQRVTSKGWTAGSGEQARLRTVTRVTAGLGELLPGDWAAQLPTEGRARWLLDASLPGLAGGDGRWRAELSSELDGLAVTAPSPLGKSRSQARAVSLQASGGPDGLDPLRLRYGDALDAVAALGTGGIERAGLRLGGEPGELPPKPGLRVRGRLDNVDGSMIRAYAARLADTGGDHRWLPSLEVVDLQVDAASVHGLSVRDLGVTAEANASGWRVDLSGPNVRGTAQISDAGSLAMDLDRLRLEGSSNTPDAAWQLAQPMTAIPNVTIRIADLRLDGRALGQFRMRLRARGRAVELAELVLDNPAALLRASGEWRRDAERSEITLTLETVDAGAVLDRFGAERRMQGGSGRVSATLAWDGPFMAPDVASLDGQVDIDLRDGSLPTLEPGAARFFGLLSLSLLPRRLMLDFAPISGEGLPFDRIEAAFAIEDGVARPDPCYLAGPMALIRVSGSVDLVQRVYDQRVSVTPQISPTLPLIGGLAAGPAAALVFFLGQDVVAQGVSPWTTLEYRLSGPWAEPRFERADAGLLEPAVEGIAP